MVSYSVMDGKTGNAVVYFFITAAIDIYKDKKLQKSADNDQIIE